MWVRRDIDNKARIVVDGVVKDVDTGGGWGTRPVLFSPLDGLFDTFLRVPVRRRRGGARRRPGSLQWMGFGASPRPDSQKCRDGGPLGRGDT